MLGVLWLGALDSNQELWQDVWNRDQLGTLGPNLEISSSVKWLWEN